ncbi:HflX-like GTP-binding protein [Candidatus Harpocratesius sp.]
MKKYAVIIQVFHPNLHQYSFAEMEGLVESAEYTICGQVTQILNRINPTYFIGKGKFKQLQKFLDGYFDTNDHATRLVNSAKNEKNSHDFDFETDFDNDLEMNYDSNLQSDFGHPSDEGVDGILVFDDNLSKNDIESVESKIKDSEENVKIDSIDFPPSLSHRSELTLIFNNRLSYSQISTLSKELGVLVKDRDDVILEIFELNARTRESKLQIELARMALQTNIIKKEFGMHLNEKQGRDFMGKGLRGWEPQLRAFRQRKKKIQKELIKISHQRYLRRKNRSKLFNIGVVGYTNAGKSTLMNTLAKTHLETANHEFTTISPVSRKVTIPHFDNYGRWAGDEVILTDSVGFIMDMSPVLIDAFLSTLEELQFSNLLLILVDCSDSMVDINQKIQTTLSILQRINIDDLPRFFLLNKIDLLTSDDLKERIQYLKLLYPQEHWFSISAQNKSTLENVISDIRKYKRMHFHQ